MIKLIFIVRPIAIYSFIFECKFQKQFDDRYELIFVDYQWPNDYICTNLLYHFCTVAIHYVVFAERHRRFRV